MFSKLNVNARRNESDGGLQKFKNFNISEGKYFSDSAKMAGVASKAFTGLTGLKVAVVCLIIYLFATNTWRRKGI